MESTTVRINPKTHIILHKISDQEGESMQAILSKAIELYRRQCFLRKANTGFASMKQDSKAWKEEEKERALWDVTLLDGLDDV